MSGAPEGRSGAEGRPGRGDPGDELVDLVDEVNRIVGLAPRRVVRRENLLHRGVGIICFNSRGEIYVHRRTETKDVFPGLHDMFVGGVVNHGEPYETAARREIDEELGISGPKPEFLFAHLYLGDLNRSWIYVYRVVWDGSIRHQAEEIVWGAWKNPEELEVMIQEKPFVPDGLEIFEHCREAAGRYPDPFGRLAAPRPSPPPGPARKDSARMP